MADKVSLADVTSVQNQTSFASTINNNNSAITSAIDNTLSRDGTSPNQMLSALDMNSNRILNLPKPVSLAEPLRLADAAGVSVSVTTGAGIPAGGTTGQVLGKTTNTDYDVSWQNSGINGQALTAGNDTNITLTTGGTPSTALLQPASITAGWTG